MKVVDRMAEKVRSTIRSFLKIEEAQGNTFQINPILDYEGNAAKNRIWYRGDAEELSQLYKEISGSNNKFWAAVPTYRRDIRKIHTGLPGIMVETLTGIVMRDKNAITVDDKRKYEWDEISKDSGFEEVLEDAVTQTLVIGDGAFKISINTEITPYPIIEFVSGEKIDIIKEYGRVKEIIFKTVYHYKSEVFTLYEAYGYGYIKYELRKYGKTVSLNSIPQTQRLRDCTFDNTFTMAVPFKVFKSPKWEGRGKSIFDGKTDSFDALDECWSQWMDALRKGRSKEYIPSDMLPRNPDTGEIMRPNAFDNAYIECESPMGEGQAKKIELIQPAIPYESYLSTYVTALDICLQGVISPSTLGIDGNKLKDDTATAQMEREKVTLHTRGKIIEAIQKTIPEVINTVFKAKDTLAQQQTEETTATVEFGEYSSPAFDAVVDTVGKAKQNGVMSIEASVEELYGDSKDEEWKKEEVARLKTEQGITEVEEPAVSEEMKDSIINDIDSVNGGDKTTLNGAQIGSLLTIIQSYAAGAISRSAAISIVTSTLGISNENAEQFIEEHT